VDTGSREENASPQVPSLPSNPASLANPANPVGRGAPGESLALSRAVILP
jgi:hypothetical protein